MDETAKEAKTAQEAKSQADERAFTEEALGMEIFWDTHKHKIIWAIVACFVLAIVAVIYTGIAEHTKTTKALELAAATTPDALLALADKYPNSEIGAVARLLLAAELREPSDLSASDAAYSEIKSPKSLSALAKLGLAQNAASAGKADEAIALYGEISEMGDRFASPLARFFAAREMMALGKYAEARTQFESIKVDFPDSVPSRLSAQYLAQIALVAPPVAEATPAATTPENQATPPAAE